MKNELSHLGYDKENEFFFKVNKELIEKHRQMLDSEKKKVIDKELEKDHWMKCPKCGHDLQEKNIQGVLIDQCQNCEGIYFDKGEWQLLMKAEEQDKFWGWLKKFFQEKN